VVVVVVVVVSFGLSPPLTGAGPPITEGQSSWVTTWPVWSDTPDGNLSES
jgi:hypothetical protein